MVDVYKKMPCIRDAKLDPDNPNCIKDFPQKIGGNYI